MGTEYACIDDETGEAYDLGRGPWYEWQEGWKHLHDQRCGPPTSREDVRALLESYMENWALGPQPIWAAAVENSIWAFVKNHPGLQVVHDLGEYEWLPEAQRIAANSGESRIYKQIGSRYDHESLIIRRNRT